MQPDLYHPVTNREDRRGRHAKPRKVTLEQVQEAMRLTDGVVSHAAKMLGVARNVIHDTLDPTHKRRRRARELETNPVRHKLLRRVHASNTDERRRAAQEGREPDLLDSEEFIKKFTNNPTCYYSGQPIDLADDMDEWQVDHLIPKYHGGRNVLDNLVLCLAAYNKAKDKLLYDEFIEMCRRVVTHHDQVRGNASVS